ncbi:Polyvinylalcohol dehydrogenase [Burkholderiales bacterium 8X]|nr:Polyvinylalcohol dehydrogenase [Burkholderiales bacterium 8X]
MPDDFQVLKDVLRADETAVIDDWMAAARQADPALGSGAANEASGLVRLLAAGLAAQHDPTALEGTGWTSLREALAALSRSRAAQGQSAGATSAFILALKKPLFEKVQRRLADRPQELAGALWTVSTAIDALAQHTVQTYQAAREDIIRRQQEELLELSTPVVKLWEGVLAVPMIGVLDSSRTQMVMEALLQQIVDTGSELAIIDITGVPTVDTLVAQHLLKTVAAIRLMGADCIISGIRPQIAQTIVHLGIDLQGISTKASLADALALALQKTGWRIVRDH